MTKILFTAAEQEELDCAIKAVELYKDRLDSTIKIDFMLTQIGTTSTCYNLTKKILEAKAANTPYTLVINIGIAGSFNLVKFPIGSASLIEKEYFADLGFETNEGFKTLFSYGIYDKDLFPYKNGALYRAKLSDNFERVLSKYAPATGVTVQSVTGEPIKVTNIKNLYSADIESMEGAAIYYVCLLEGVPSFEIRTVSNAVGERDKSKWDIPYALKTLNSCCNTIVEHIITKD